VTLLRRGGLSTLDRDPGRYGLPLILGSGEIRLIDLTNLYATLAMGGDFKPATIQAAGSRQHTAATTHAALSTQHSALFSKESSALVTDILTELKRPDLPRSWHLTREAPSVAWKTGTSYGHRDAWSVGYSERYSIGVWAGNFDGHGQKGLSGSEFAAPLLFDLFRAIEGNAAHPRRFADVVLGEVEVCAQSHQLPTPACRDRVRVTTIPGRTRLRACEMHRPIFIDAGTRQRLAGDCVATVPHVRVVATVDPPELIAWRRSQNQPFDSLPPMSPKCSDVAAADAAPRITSPDGATPYRLRRDAPLEFQEILLAAQSSDASQLFWFQDGTLVASGETSRRLFLAPTRGTHRLVVVDDAGRSDEVSYRVE